MSLSTVFEMPLAPLCLYAAVAGVISHLAYFIRGEHHRQSLVYLKLTLYLPAAATISQYVFTNLGLWTSALRSVAVTSSFLTALWTSMLLYRIFFHPLRHFPGPFGAKISKLWHVGRVAPKLTNHIMLNDLRQEYGDFVRTGPNEISVFAPDGVSVILGARSKCSKAPWYDNSLPLVSLHGTRDKAAHDQRRKIWDQGFTATALRDYEGRVLGHARGLIQQIAAHAGQEVNATNWFQLFGFDVMTDIAFGKSYDMVKSGKRHNALDLLAKSMRASGGLAPAPWLFTILKAIPGLAKDYKIFVAWCAEQVMQRVKMDKQILDRDIMSWIVEAYEKAPDPTQEQHWLTGDSRLIIVAGSDTTSATLTFACYELAANPEQLIKLRQELAPFVKDDSSFDFKDLQNLDHLNAVINETLRLHPPVPSGVDRVTPPEGIHVKDTFIPGNVTVISPTYAVSRSEHAFAQPNDFIPERWHSRPELVKVKSAFAPFSLGAYSCIGKQLALMELRIVLAMVAQRFDIAFAPGEDGSHLVNDSQDCFTISLQELRIVFSPRKA